MVIPKRSSMQKTAPQTKAETQLFLKDNDEISRESGEKVPKDPFKFALRDPSIRNEHKQKIITSFTDATNLSKSKQKTESMTINKLRFHLVHLLGRDEEVKNLSACLERMMQPGRQTKELVMISGYSGTGKTTLASTLQTKVNSVKEGGAFVTGKFDQFRSGEPLSAISQALGELCRKVANEGQSICNKIEEALQAELQNEVFLLTQIIPDMDRIMTTKIQSSKASHDINSDARQTRLNYALRVFTRVMCSFFSPLVICLDDLQWADVSSLEIIELLASDVQNKSALMIIGCYRSNEVEGNHVLSDFLSNLHEMQTRNDDLLSLTQMELGNLGKEEVNQAIMALLSVDKKSHTDGLASICYRRTMGNPFFLFEFLRLLEEEGLLSFHLGLFQWKWDEKNISLKTASTENVVDLLQRKMEKLPQETQGFLQCISCLGASFTIKTIDMIWKHRRMIGIDSSTVESGTEELLATLVEENYLETCKNNKYRWTHDNVEQAASSLIEEDTRASFRRSIGEIWYRELGEDHLAPYLFEVANLLNTTGIDVVNIDYAKINLRAAEKAREISAFDSCSNYASQGINMLPENKWDSEPGLAVKLHSLAAEAEGFLGHHSRMDSYCNEVLSQSLIPTLEKKDVYLAKLHRMANAELQYVDAIKLCLVILKDLGCTFPGGGVVGLMKALISMRKTVKMVKQTPTEVLASLPVVTDPFKLATMTLFSRLGEWAYLAGEKFLYLYLLSTAKMVQMTLLHGLFEWSASSLSALGALSLFVNGDVGTAQYIGECALQMQERCESEAGKARTIYVVHTFLFQHVKPMQSFSKPLIEGYQSGMRTGDKDFAMWCLFFNIVTLYMGGKPLKFIEEQCQASISQMDELKEEEQASCLRMFWQLFFNLMGSSNSTIELCGEAINEQEVVFTDASHAAFVVVKIIASSLSGRYELGAHLNIEKGDKQYLMIKGGINPAFMFWFHRSLCLYAMARKNKKKRRHYMAQAKLIRKEFTKSLKNKNPNVLHYVILLKAEQAALKRKRDQENVRKLYNDAITTAARGGYVHDAALAQERFADFLLNEVGDTEGAKYHIEEAIQRHTNWGAMGIVEHLRDKYQDVLTGSSKNLH